MGEQDKAAFRVPGPMEVLRLLPGLGINLVLPAMVMGAVAGSLLDLLLGHDGYVLAKVGILAGPLIFAVSINALHRAEARARTHLPNPDAYRAAETAKRMEAARKSGAVIPFKR
jgi:hypothetical protein